MAESDISIPSGDDFSIKFGSQLATDVWYVKDSTSAVLFSIAADGTFGGSVIGIGDNELLAMDDADAADNDYVKLTATGAEGRSYAEVKEDLDLEAGIDFYSVSAMDILLDAKGDMNDLVDDTSPQLGGTLDCNGFPVNLGEGSTSVPAGVLYDHSIGTNLQWSGDYIDGVTYASAVTFPNRALFLTTTAGTFNLAQGNSLNTLYCVALALDTGSVGDKKALIRGYIRDDNWNWTIGSHPSNSVIWVDPSIAGGLTQTKPAGGGTDFAQKVGYATSADEMYFDPQLEHEVI